MQIFSSDIDLRKKQGQKRHKMTKKKLRSYDGFGTISAGIMSQKQAFETNPGLG
jgi:hypothetical protein